MFEQAIHFQVTFPEDLRIKKLERRTGASGFRSLVTLILQTGAQHPTGDLSKYDDLDIECLANWKGDDGVLVTAMRESNLLNGRQLANDFWYRGKLPPRRITPQFRRNKKLAFARDNGICQYCRQPAIPPFCDHFLPVSKGGTDALDNLRTACGQCNASKGDSDPHTWAESKGYSV